MNLETYYGFDRTDPEHIKRLKEVLAKDGKKRWQAAAQMYLWLNPTGYAYSDDGTRVLKATAQEEDEVIRQEVIELRKGLGEVSNEQGRSRVKDSNNRYSLRMPATMLQFIELVDPTLFEGTPAERKASVRNLIKAFPEYAVLTKV